MTVTLLVISDGRREYIEQSIPSALSMLRGKITRKIIYDDTGDALEREWLREQFPMFTVAHHPEGRQGFGGAIRFMWDYLTHHDQNKFVLHVEQDFTFNREVDVNVMCALLDTHPSLVQVALRRQACNAAERAAGGVVEANPEAFIECEFGGQKYLIHREFLTTNPCVYRRSLCSRGWPDDPHSEGKLGAIIRNESIAPPFAYWGARSDAPWVEHIGAERAGVGY